MDESSTSLPETTPATEAAAAAGVSHRVVRTAVPESAEESAALQGIPLTALLRTIVVRRAANDYLFVLVPAGRRFDWPKLRAHLGINRITVQNAYAQLEAEGLIFTRTGSGTYVLPQAPLAPIPKRAPGAPWPLWQTEAEARALWTAQKEARHVGGRTEGIHNRSGGARWRRALSLMAD